ncbi:MAG: Rieske (2Fe-2S) protein [Bacteroidia bacterium]|nr:Rieske (2Fe-2S) protein [Bacteroidia bacterium]
MSNRRSFIKAGGKACIGVCGFLPVLNMLSSCSTTGSALAVVKPDSIEIPETEFQSKKILIIKNKILEFDVAVIAKPDKSYYALRMECTHQMNPVQFTGNGFYCPTHGSRFNMDGNVTEEPAQFPLKRYKVTIESGNVIVHLNT